MAKMTLKLPKLAVSMREGTVVEWLVEPGTVVEIGQPIYVVESEKTSSEIVSPFAGTIGFLFELGAAYPVGEPIAEIVT
jgi:glutaconyl-CoA/methylmalonyl-CoA decarboxylase subunit gamma